jgi:prepilin peptidase CpaA
MPFFTVLPTLFLGSATYFDIRFSRIPNALILIGAGVALAQAVVVSGFSGLVSALSAGLLVFALCLPLFLGKIFGGGDVKLMTVLGLFTSTSAILTLFLSSLIWAAIFGLIYILVKRQTRSVVTNVRSLVMGAKQHDSALHRIPFALPVFMAWLSYVLTLIRGVP